MHDYACLGNTNQQVNMTPKEGNIKYFEVKKKGDQTLNQQSRVRNGTKGT